MLLGFLMGDSPSMRHSHVAADYESVSSETFQDRDVHGALDRGLAGLEFHV